MNIIAIIVTTVALGSGGSPDSVKSQKIHTIEASEKQECTPDFVDGIRTGLQLSKNPKKFRIEVDCKQAK